MRLLFQIIIIVGCVTLLALIIWRNRKTLTRETGLGYVIAIVLCLASLLPTLIPETTNPDYFELTRPNLEPQLLIALLPSNEYVCSFLIQNTGHVTAKNIAFIHRQDGFRGIDNMSSRRLRELAPGARMTLDPTNGVPLKMPQDGRPLFIQLWCSYSGNLDDKRHDIVSWFTFKIRTTLLDQKVFTYTSSAHTEGELTPEEKARILGFWTQFDNPANRPVDRTR